MALPGWREYQTPPATSRSEAAMPEKARFLNWTASTQRIAKILRGVGRRRWRLRDAAGIPAPPDWIQSLATQQPPLPLPRPNWILWRSFAQQPEFPIRVPTGLATKES